MWRGVFGPSIVATLGGNADVGFGLVIGSALIAFGLVPPLCYFAVAPQPLRLAAWPVVRDTLAYLAALAAVVGFMFGNGGEIDLYESVGLIVFYAGYVAVVLAFAAPAAAAAGAAVSVRAAPMSPTTSAIGTASEAFASPSKNPLLKLRQVAARLKLRQPCQRV